MYRAQCLRRMVSKITGESGRIPADKMHELFAGEQMSKWPRGYRPLEGIASFLDRNGVMLQELFDARKVLTRSRARPDTSGYGEGHRMLARDLSIDTLLWMRCAFNDFVESQLDDRKVRLLRKISKRDRLPTYFDVRDVFMLPGLTPPCIFSSNAKVNASLASTDMPTLLGKIEAETVCADYLRVVAENELSRESDADVLSASEEVFSSSKRRSSPLQMRKAKLLQQLSREQQKSVESHCNNGGLIFRGTSFAGAQEKAMAALKETAVSKGTVNIDSLPELRNLLYTEYVSYSPLKQWSRVVGDSLVLTQEFIAELALYLTRRVDEEIPRFRSAMAKRGTPVPPNHIYCILCPFGNGRLGHFLNESGLLPENVEVVTINVDGKAGSSQAPKSIKEAREARGSGTVSSKTSTSSVSDSTKKVNSVVASMIEQHKLPASYDVSFNVVDGSATPLSDLLDAYQPIIIIAEPHTSRDYSADFRGYFSVQEVLFIGQVDSPAMGSFTYPWLTFGVYPGSDTYWVYGDTLKIEERFNSHAGQLPVDPPYLAQGYKRVFLNRISATLIHSNDTVDVPHQAQALAFRRL